LTASVEAAAATLDFLSQLEREEASLLTWGVIDAGFSAMEVEERASQFAASNPLCQTAGLTGDELMDSLTARHLLLSFAGARGSLYRTRMAETIRLLARLRQLFPDDIPQGTWQSAPSLVADFRFALRPRRYPKRDIPPDALLRQLGSTAVLGEREAAVVKALASVEPRSFGLSAFQVDATARILAAVQRPRASGIVVAAGTGTGKTLAFYLPAMALIASHIDETYWPKVVAMYPRVELLKDQCSQAAVEARRASVALRQHGARSILVGALYGATPRNRADVPVQWERRSTGYVCPFLRCPECDSSIIWREDDLAAGRERLYCIVPSCSGSLLDHEVVLTRERMRVRRPDLLMTTTEMVNRCLGASVDRPLIGIAGVGAQRPRLILLDEVHTYAGTTGAQNALVLRRWRHALGRQPTFVGLSATLREARSFFAEVTGLGEHEVMVIEPAQADLIEEGMEYTLALRSDPTSGATVLATTIQTAMLLRRMLDPRASGSSAQPVTSGRVFAFTDDLDVTNRLYWSLQDAEGWDAFGRPRPPSAERPARALAALRSPHLPDHPVRFHWGQSWDACVEIGHSLSNEAQLRVERTSSQDVSYSDQADVVVTTSSLDVGLDDPTVGAIIQHKSPRESAQFVQRRGRAGRVRGSRPWTAVVLSDVGRDRIAYEEYEKLFDPELRAQTLPLRNRYVLRMQAAFATLDWMCTRLPDVRNLRLELAAPAAESGEWAQINADRQQKIASLIASTLGDRDLQDALAAHLKAALRISDEEVDALLWYPPRAVLTAVLPTALRRLHTGWRSVGGPSAKEPFGRDPLPEFVPPNLFSDLLLPEVTVVVPPARRGEDPVAHPLSILQAIQEFAPGRASRRYAVEHGHQRHWSPIPDDEPTAVIDVGAYCDGDRIGTLRFRDGTEEREFVCVRPFIIRTQGLPSSLRDTSNARPIWRTRIEPIRTNDEGSELDLPEDTAWRTVLAGITAFTHELGSGVTVHRYSIGSDATLLTRRGSAQRVQVRFSDGLAEDRPPAAVGLTMEVDGLAVRFRRPTVAAMEHAGRSALSRSLRLSLFRHRIESDSILAGQANDFQLAALGDALVGAFLTQALRIETTLQEIHEGWSLVELQEAMVAEISGERLERNVLGEGPVDAEQVPDQNEEPRRLAALIELCRSDDVAARLRDHATALWSNPGEPGWDTWYGQRYASTLGAAVIDACYRLCPQSSRQELALDFIGHDSPEEGLFWITEVVPGGTGVIQSVIESYAEDPRRFLHLIEASLAPAEQEVVGDALAAVTLLSQATEGQSLRVQLDAVRRAWPEGRLPLSTAFACLVDELRTLALPTTHGVLSALNARILRPGSGPLTDKLIAQLVNTWNEIEAGLGLEVDLRQFAAWAADAPSVVEMVNGLPGAQGQGAPWRLSVVTGLLWPRGSSVRARVLNASHRFATHPPADWQLVRNAVDWSRPVVELDSEEWESRLEATLLASGSAILRTTPNKALRLKAELLRRLARPIDAGYLLAFPRTSGWHRTATSIDITLELREARQ